MRRTNRKKCAMLGLVLVICCVWIGGCRKDADEEQTFANVQEVSEQESDSKSSDADEENEPEETSGETGGEDTDASIYVDVRGQVNAPGVYVLSSDSRVFEAIEKAGGMTKDAADSSVNQAQKLTDGQQIYVPSEKEVKNGEKTGAAALTDDQAQTKASGNGAKINLNTATREDLMTLNGIGEAKADAILRYREEHGNFSSIEDIKKIEGIKDGIFNKVKDQITV